MKISITLAIIIALIIVGGALSAVNGYLQKDKDLIAYGICAFVAGILFTIIGTFKKEVETSSKDESVPGGGFEM